MASITWSEKYRPKRFVEIRGQDLAIVKLKDFLKKKAPGKKAIILHGSPGTGKTSLAHVIANEINSEIFELNASDLRDREKILSVLKPAAEQQSLLKRGKIILLPMEQYLN